MDANTEGELRRRLDNQKASLTALQELLAQSETQRALLSDLLDRERDKTADMARRLDRVADVVQTARVRCAKPTAPNSTTPTTP